jgi:ADP-ribose pyrophosphatase YjhB (NUDIX family)
MRCGGCGFVYFHNCAAAAAAIIETGEAILLTVRGEDPQKGCYDLPGGFADYRESLEQSLTREIREELNLEIRNFRYLGSFPNVYSFEGVTYFTTDAIFVAEAPSLQALKVDREIQEVVIAGAKEIDLARIGFESIREGIKRYLKTCRHL